MHSLLRVCGLLSVATIMATLHGLILGTEGSTLEADAHALTLAEAMALDNVLWVDARAEEAFSEEHFPHALNVNETNWGSSLGEFLVQWDPETAVVVYCDGAECGTSRAIAARLREQLDSDSVYWLEGGWDTLEAGKEHW